MLCGLLHRIQHDGKLLAELMRCAAVIPRGRGASSAEMDMREVSRELLVSSLRESPDLAHVEPFPCHPGNGFAWASPANTVGVQALAACLDVKAPCLLRGPLGVGGGT